MPGVASVDFNNMSADEAWAVGLGFTNMEVFKEWGKHANESDEHRFDWLIREVCLLREEIKELKRETIRLSGRITSTGCERIG